MVRFAGEYPETATDQLSINYRSSEEVVQTFESVAPHMGASDGMFRLKLKSDSGPSGLRPQLRRFDTLDVEAPCIAASVRVLERQSVTLRHHAILCCLHS